MLTSWFTSRSRSFSFDFSHFGPMTNDEIDQVERLVNEEIWKGIDVNIQRNGYCFS